MLVCAAFVGEEVPKEREEVPRVSKPSVAEGTGTFVGSCGGGVSSQLTLIILVFAKLIPVNRRSKRTKTSAGSPALGELHKN